MLQVMGKKIFQFTMNFYVYLNLCQLSLNAGQKYCRMLQREHSAILSIFIKLPFVTKIFVLSIFEWPFYTGFTVTSKNSFHYLCSVIYRPPDKRAELNINFLISQPKHMLWVLKRFVSMRRSFGATKTHV